MDPHRGTAIEVDVHHLRGQLCHCAAPSLVGAANDVDLSADGQAGGRGLGGTGGGGGDGATACGGAR
eukprot:2901373-Prymnesium_polylepis.1